MALSDYLTSEVCADCSDGLITRREAMRRLGLMGLSATAAGFLLAACGSDDQPSAATSSPGTSSPGTSASTASTAPPTTAGASTTAGSTAPASTSPASTAPASTTPVSFPTLPVEAVSFAGPAGDLLGSYAEADGPKGAVLIIHENRGLTDHFVTLPGRFAASGYSALSLDLLSRLGGTASFTDPAAAMAGLSSLPGDQLVADMRAGLDELGRRVPGAGMGIVGFCFGGGQVWSLLAAGEPRLGAAAPFYGPGPEGADFSGSKAAVLGVYAELDSRVNGSKDAMDAALTSAGLVHELRVFPGVDHAFFNDTGQRFNAAQAAAAYAAVLDWFTQHLTPS